ncbi:MAG TPA: YcbK family protein [Stellaceae bacterium]|nr:YcbK family protein [Stellaceae bacterium]
MTSIKRPTRRKFLLLAGATSAGVMAAPSFPMPAIALPFASYKRSLAFHNLRTGDKLDIVYWADGRYIPDASREIARVMRDGRTDEVHSIDNRLVELMQRLRSTLRSSEPIQVVCGYRSPETNAMLHETTEGVASNSLHMDGEAVDLRLIDRPLAYVRRVAVGLKAGGVGYYPHSNFVHVDVGAVRQWS